jgi:hypothetical protein
MSMVWTMHEYEKEVGNTAKRIVKKQYAVNDEGVEIEVLGPGPEYAVYFEYRDGDINVTVIAAEEVGAREPMKRPNNDWSLGPVAWAGIGDHRAPLTPDERDKVKKNFTEFLIQEFPRFRWLSLRTLKRWSLVADFEDELNAATGCSSMPRDIGRIFFVIALLIFPGRASGAQSDRGRGYVL